MATYDREQLRAKVLERLGVLDPAQATSAEDAATVDQAVQTTLEDLYEDGLIPFDVDTDSIPAAHYKALSKVVAYDLIEAFGIVGDRAVKLSTGNDEGMRRLRSLKTAGYAGGVVQSEYF